MQMEYSFCGWAQSAFHIVRGYMCAYVPVAEPVELRQWTWSVIRADKGGPRIEYIIYTIANRLWAERGRRVPQRVSGERSQRDNSKGFCDLSITCISVLRIKHKWDISRIMSTCNSNTITGGRSSYSGPVRVGGNNVLPEGGPQRRATTIGSSVKADMAKGAVKEEEQKKRKRVSRRMSWLT